MGIIFVNVILFFHIYLENIVLKVVGKSKSWEYYAQILF